MALIDKLRFHNILTGAGLPEAPSLAFTEALDETFDEHISPLATRNEMQQAIANAVLEIKRDAAEREARMVRTIFTASAIIIAAMALAAGIIIAFT